MLGLTISSKLDWGSISLAKSVSKTNWSTDSFHEVSFSWSCCYLYKSTKWPCMECCYVWAGTPSCYLELLYKLQKRISRTVGPSLVASLESLAHCGNVASLSLFYRYYFGRKFIQTSSTSSTFLFLVEVYSLFWQITFLDVLRISMSKVFFLAQLDPGIFCL